MHSVSAQYAWLWEEGKESRTRNVPVCWGVRMLGEVAARVWLVSSRRYFTCCLWREEAWGLSTFLRLIVHHCVSLWFHSCSLDAFLCLFVVPKQRHLSSCLFKSEDEKMKQTHSAGGVITPAAQCLPFLLTNSVSLSKRL